MRLTRPSQRIECMTIGFLARGKARAPTCHRGRPVVRERKELLEVGAGASCARPRARLFLRGVGTRARGKAKGETSSQAWLALADPPARRRRDLSQRPDRRPRRLVLLRLRQQRTRAEVRGHRRVWRGHRDRGGGGDVADGNHRGLPPQRPGKPQAPWRFAGRGAAMKTSRRLHRRETAVSSLGSYPDFPSLA